MLSNGVAVAAAGEDYDSSGPSDDDAADGPNNVVVYYCEHGHEVRVYGRPRVYSGQPPAVD